MMTSAGRTDAIFAAVSSTEHFQKMSDDEREAVRAQIEATFGDAGDLGYLKSAAEILPGSLATPAGVPVTTPSGPGSIVNPVGLTGAGTLT